MVLRARSLLRRMKAAHRPNEAMLYICVSALGVRRDKAALSSGCKSHPATAPAGSNRSSYGCDEIAEAFGMRVTGSTSSDVTYCNAVPCSHA
jgi:hypothetical protein